MSWNQIELVQYLLSVGANIHLRDTDGDTPLLVCETPEMMQLLLASGAKIDDVNSEGEHLFEKVMEDENIIMIQYMIENKHIDDAKAEKAMECKYLYIYIHIYISVCRYAFPSTLSTYIIYLS